MEKVRIEVDLNKNNSNKVFDVETNNEIKCIKDMYIEFEPNKSPIVKILQYFNDENKPIRLKDNNNRSQAALNYIEADLVDIKIV